MDLGSRLYRLHQWTHQLPRWSRPPIYGAFFILALIGLRGGLIAFPLLALGLALTSHHVARDLLLLAGAVVLALIGGATSGVAYALAQRWLRPLPVVGRGLAGMMTVAPYMLALTAIVHVQKAPRWNSPIGGADIFAFCLCTVIFGLVLASED